MVHKHNKKQEQAIARERIAVLFTQAKIRFKEYSHLSHRYVALARTIAMKCKVTIPSQYKRQFCKKCHHFLVPGINCIVRLTKKKNIVYHCKDCKHYNKFGYRTTRT